MSRIQFKYALSDFTGKDISVKRKMIASDYRLHWHECCEIELVLLGSGTHILNGVEYPIRPGDVYMLTPADCHELHISTPTEVMGIMFDEKMLNQEIYESILTRETMGQNLIAHFSGHALTAVNGLFEALYYNEECSEEGSEPDFGNRYIGNLLDCILMDLLRSCGQPCQVSAKSPAGTAILYLHSHYTEKITLATLAGLTHLSPNYFSEMFKDVTGHTFKSYLIDLRLRNARRLLVNTDMTVTDICYACGFESFSNFMRTFKQRCGISPLKFRTINKSEKTQ
ncbi:MAG: helix-turn-helix domain-containing protein [Clostridia bacterium]|nr:helix-turn-helix domain-containing protein [Clostridia bacterium]